MTPRNNCLELEKISDYGEQYIQFPIKYAHQFQ